MIVIILYTNILIFFSSHVILEKKMCIQRNEKAIPVFKNKMQFEIGRNNKFFKTILNQLLLFS